MQLFNVIESRRSIRDFQDKEIPDEMLHEVIKAAMLAPSAGNQQPWHFIIVRDRLKMKAVPSFHPYAKMVPKAPAAILICGNPEGIKWPTFWPQDCSAATQNLLLAARAIGLGTVWAGIYPEQERIEGARKLFGIPESVIPFAIVPIGWPDTEFKAMKRFQPDRIHHDNW